MAVEYDRIYLFREPQRKPSPNIVRHWAIAFKGVLLVPKEVARALKQIQAATHLERAIGMRNLLAHTVVQNDHSYRQMPWFQRWNRVEQKIRKIWHHSSHSFQVCTHLCNFYDLSLTSQWLCVRKKLQSLTRWYLADCSHSVNEVVYSKVPPISRLTVHLWALCTPSSRAKTHDLGLSRGMVQDPGIAEGHLLSGE